MEELKTFEGAKTHYAARQAMKMSASGTCTASYADLGEAIDCGNLASIAFIIKNTHGSLTGKWKVLGSNDNVTYVEIQAEATVSNGATDKYSAAALYRYYKVQVIDGSGHATFSLTGIGKA